MGQKAPTAMNATFENGNNLVVNDIQKQLVIKGRLCHGFAYNVVRNPFKSISYANAENGNEFITIIGDVGRGTIMVERVKNKPITIIFESTYIETDCDNSPDYYNIVIQSCDDYAIKNEYNKTQIYQNFGNPKYYLD